MSHEELKSKVESLRRRADKAAGVLSEQMKQLKKEFGCKSLKEAQKLLKKLQEEEHDDLERLQEEVEAFEREYARLLD